MKILIVDDEHLARERLRDLILEIESDHELFEAKHGLDALEQQTEHSFDLILLDIRMPVMDGLETARHLTKLDVPPAVVFTTAYQDHALEAFDAQAVDYLLKPVKLERLQQALEKSRMLSQGQLQALNDNDQERQEEFISAKSNTGLRIAPIQEVFFFRAEQKYVSAFCAEGELILDESLKELEQNFARHLIRIHRNTLVQRQQIIALEKDTEGNTCVSMKDHPEKLVVSRRHVSSVRDFLKSR